MRRTVQTEVYMLNDEQITNILDRLVPLIAAPEDHDFFRATLRIAAESTSSSGFAAFASDLLKST